MGYDIKIDTISYDDLKNIFDLGKKKFHLNSIKKWNTETLSEILLLSSDFCLVAKYRSKILGFIIAEKINTNIVIIHWLTIDNPKKFPWLQKKLTKEFINVCKNNSINKIHSILEKNSINIDFLNELNFTEIEQYSKLELDLENGDKNEESRK